MFSKPLPYKVAINYKGKKKKKNTGETWEIPV